MSDKPVPRPPQVRMCGIVIMVGSVFVLLQAFDHMGALGTIEAQERAADFVSGTGKGLGLTVDEVQSALRVMCLVVGGASVASAILGWQVLQRQRSARLALSVLAPVLVVAGYPSSGPIASIVGVGVLLLWLQPARDWFDGVVPQRPNPLEATRTEQPERARVPAGVGATGAVPPPPPPPSHPGSGPGPGLGWPPPTPAVTARPASVFNAAVLTITTSAVVAAGLLYGFLDVITNQAKYESDVADQLASQPMYDDIEPGLVVNVLLVMTVVFAVWGLLAIGLAVLTLRGNGAARIALIISAFGSALVCLVTIVAVVTIVPLAISLGVAVMLLRRDAGAWFRARRVHPPS